MTFYVGAYAASPALHNAWDPATEAQYMAGLRSMSAISGLEVGFYDDIHLYDPQWFLGELKPSWTYLLTSVPGTMNRLSLDPEFGLASLSNDGRKAAWAFADHMRAGVEKMNKHFGKKVVQGVIVHSAPKLTQPPSQSHCTRFSESLMELATWDWFGAELLVEHCDSPRPDHSPAKGFLKLKQEIQAVQGAQNQKTPVGMLINWGRSALESRDPQAPVAHIQQVRAHHLLRGLMFSGCTQENEVYGHWADTHAPFAPSRFTSAPDQSLMTKARAVDCLNAAGRDSPLHLGFKIQALPAALAVSERLELIADSIKTLDSAVRFATPSSDDE